MTRRNLALLCILAAAAPAQKITAPPDARTRIDKVFTQFNRPDGAGYAFLVDFVLGLDKRNPQTAARLLVSFRSWRALEEGRPSLVQARTGPRRAQAFGLLWFETVGLIEF